MKKVSILFVLLVLLCAPAFSAKGFVIQEKYFEFDEPPFPIWNNKTPTGKYFYYCYYVLSAPEEYKSTINMYIFYDQSYVDRDIGGAISNCFDNYSMNTIKESLKNDNFYIRKIEGCDVVCLTKTTPLKTFEEQKSYIYKILTTKYAGFKDMKKKGFTQKIWDSAENYDDIRKIFNTYMNDYHFSIKLDNEIIYKSEQIFDEGCSKSEDTDYTFYYVNTPNTFYIRCNNCYSEWEDYNQLPSLAEEAAKKDFIVLDFRSNHGGDNSQQYDFFNKLLKLKYKGTVYITQDNWSYSSGEVWEVASNYKKKINCILVGTHSGGMQYYGNCEDLSYNNLFMWVPTKSFKHGIDSNYLGEGKGYEPQIWSLPVDLKKTLEEQGLDLTGVEIK